MLEKATAQERITGRWQTCPIILWCHQVWYPGGSDVEAGDRAADIPVVFTILGIVSKPISLPMN